MRPLLFIFCVGAHGLIALAAAPSAKAELPIAYVLERDKPDGATPAADRLRQAGFDVRPLPLNQSPRTLEGLILLGSFASQSPVYTQYMQQYATELYHFVDRGNLLVQLTQADQVEKTPPFLPTTQAAVRGDDDAERLLVVTPESPLLAGMPVDDGVLAVHGRQLGWELMQDYGGFEVVLAADPLAQRVALVEGAYGQGRIVLSAVPFDLPPAAGKAGPDPQVYETLAGRFFANLFEHTRNVRQLQTRALRIAEPPADLRALPEGAWSIAVLPDTQVYSLRYPGLFAMQTLWVKQNAAARNIRYLIHLGDLVNNNTDLEWQRAHAAMSILDGTVPYALVPGNHDYGPSGDASTRDTGLNTHFSFDTTAALCTFGGAMEEGKLDNTYHLFEVNGEAWIILALEWGPRDATIDWANGVMEQHPGRRGILVTHAYLNHNDRRYDHTDTQYPQDYNPHEYRTPGGVNDGEELWQKLVRHHNFVVTLNGHVLQDGTGYRVDLNDAGQPVHQILANYQMRELGGEGYLRLLEFMPDGDTLRLRTYSPLYDRDLLESDQTFTISLQEFDLARQQSSEDLP